LLRAALLDRVATEADQPGLVRVQCQFERAQSLVQVVQESLCLMPKNLVRFERVASRGHRVISDAAERAFAVIRDFVPH
jgi:hypothetical protein